MMDSVESMHKVFIWQMQLVLLLACHEFLEGNNIAAILSPFLHLTTTKKYWHSFYHIISSLESKFSASAITTSTLIGIVPSVLCSSDVNFDNVIAQYEQDLPSPELFSLELKR